MALFSCMFMIMGLFSCLCGVGRILFADRRVRDVIAWYQSSCCSMGLHGPPRCSDSGRISFCPAEIKNLMTGKLPKICLSVEQSEHLVEQTSNIVEELVERTSDVAEELDESTPDGNSLKENHGKIV